MSGYLQRAVQVCASHNKELSRDWVRGSTFLKKAAGQKRNSSSDSPTLHRIGLIYHIARAFGLICIVWALSCIYIYLLYAVLHAAPCFVYPINILNPHLGRDVSFVLLYNESQASLDSGVPLCSASSLF